MLYNMKKWLPGAAAALLVLALSVALGLQVHRAEAAEHTLAESTLAALADATEEVQSLSLAMEKLSVATSSTQSASLLHQAVLHADLARHSLARLPAEPQVLSPVLAWFSELSDSCASLLTRLASGLPVTDGEMDEVTARTTDLRLLHAELDLALSALLDGAPLPEALPPTVIATPAAMEMVAWRALPSEEINQGTALQLAKAFVGENRVLEVSPAPDVSGAMPTFGVTVRTADLQLNLEVTRRGGKVLLMTPETAGFPMLKTPAECEAAASAFLREQGFVSMAAAYFQVYDGLCVLTFAHEQESALVWPDRVVVQVRMDTAEVVGLESSSYWKNHTPRRLGAPPLTAEEAARALSPAVEVASVRLAVLNTGALEKLCWQFTVTREDETYICFIDAATGQELLVEKMMQTEYGAIPA